MSNQATVLIVGAGPTGLMMACELARHGITARIIDKKSEPIYASNAAWVQTLTLEIFEHLKILDNFLEIGNQCDAINLYIEGQPIARVPMEYIPSIYPFFLMISQRETERLLNEYLAELDNYVHRGIELLDVKQDKGKVHVSLMHDDDKVENAEYDWVIACDGVNSTVREKCDIFFPGEDINEQFVVADADISSSFMPTNEVHIYFNNGNVFAAFPLGDDHYRITANLHLEHKRTLYTNKELVEMAQERAHGAFYVKNAVWISLFWIHSKCIQNLRQGAIFFAGDAAHVHSPAGGQGMNTGLQDAYNLAWKLALVIKGQAAAELLDTYDIERKPVISHIVKETNRFTKMVLFDPDFLTKLREFAKTAEDNQQLIKEFTTTLTQLGIHYKLSPIIEYNETEKSGVQAGYHAPNARLDADKTLYEILHNPFHNILLFTGNKIDAALIKQLQDIQKTFHEKYNATLQTHIISKEKIENVVHDSEGAVHAMYEVTNPTVIILRPDNYIAYRSNSLDGIKISTFLKRYLM